MLSGDVHYGHLYTTAHSKPGTLKSQTWTVRSGPRSAGQSQFTNGKIIRKLYMDLKLNAALMKKQSIQPSLEDSKWLRRYISALSFRKLTLANTQQPKLVQDSSWKWSFALQSRMQLASFWKDVPLSSRASCTGSPASPTGSQKCHPQGSVREEAMRPLWSPAQLYEKPQTTDARAGRPLEPKEHF